MSYLYNLSTLVSIMLFLSYGILCLFADGMVADFKRFGLSRFRRLTGGLEVLGALGLVAGYAVPTIGLLSAGGLSLLMLLGVATRVRVRDSLLESVPAAFLMLLNAFIAVCLWRSQFAGR